MAGVAKLQLTGPIFNILYPDSNSFSSGTDWNKGIKLFLLWWKSSKNESESVQYGVFVQTPCTNFLTSIIKYKYVCSPVCQYSDTEQEGSLK